MFDALNIVIVKLPNHIKKYGLKTVLKRIKYYLHNYYYEMYFGVKTSGNLNLDELRYNNKKNLQSYEPAGYEIIDKLINIIEVDFSESTFLDYGCGKGRAVIVAAQYPFNKIIGIDLSDNLTDIAKHNVVIMKHKVASSVNIINIDAIDYQIPDCVNIVYFFNPFVGEILDNIINNIFISYHRAPRKLYVLFINNIHFEKKIADCKWIIKVCSGMYYNDPWGIYSTYPVPCVSSR